MNFVSRRVGFALCVFALAGCHGECDALDGRLRVDLGAEYADFERAGGLDSLVPPVPVARAIDHVRDLVDPKREQICELYAAPEHYERFTLPMARYRGALRRDPATAGSRPSAAPPQFESSMGWAAYALVPIFVLGTLIYAFVARRRPMGS